MNNKPMVTMWGILSMQVCVPKDWTDEQVKEFADKENPSGTESGWIVRKTGDPALNGAPERVECEGSVPARENFVHIMLDC